jgi:hypothetical protein
VSDFPWLQRTRDDAGMTLRLGINLGYQDWANGLPQAVSLVQRAVAMGLISSWRDFVLGTV